MNIRDYDPADGCAFQGDVSIIPIPDDIKIDTADEIAPRDGRLILQEGEISGHHHAIQLRHFQAQPKIAGDPLLTRDPKLRKAFGGKALGGAKAEVPAARLFRDPRVAQEMVARGILTRADLAIGCLVVARQIVVTHEEHDGIRLPPRSYLIGGQVESVGAEQRRVAD